MGHHILLCPMLGAKQGNLKVEHVDWVGNLDEVSPAVLMAIPHPFASTQILEDKVFKQVFVTGHGGKGTGANAKLEGIHVKGRSGASCVWLAEYANFTLNWASRGWSVLHCMHASHHAKSLQEKEVNVKRECLVLFVCIFFMHQWTWGLTCLSFLALDLCKFEPGGSRQIFWGTVGPCCKSLVVIYQIQACTRKIEKIGGSKRT